MILKVGNHLCSKKDCPSCSLTIDFMNRVALASHYYHTYRRFLLSILISLAFITSICTTLQQLNPNNPSSPSSPIGLVCKVLSVGILLLLLIERSPWTYLLYPALLCIHTWLSSDFAIEWMREKGLRRMKSGSFWLTLLVIVLLLQTYITPFFHRWTTSIGIVFLLLDALRRWHG